MSPRNRYVDSHSQVASSTIFAAVRCSSSLGPKRKRSSASSSRPVPATTPYRRPFGSRRACTSKIARIPAVPLRSAPSSIVSSYWSVNNARLGSCGAAVFTARNTSRPVAPVWHHGGMRAAPVLRLAPFATKVTIAPERVREPIQDEDVAPDRPWVTIVWNDPVNLMSYVTYVFQQLFGYSRQKATALMLDVHHKGRAVVSSGTREQMEHDVARLHVAGLWATLAQD